MRFLARGIFGLLLFGITAAAISFGVYRFYDAVTQKQVRGRPPVTERSYAVNTDILKAEEIEPVTVVYGQVRSWRNLQIRPSSEGRLVDAAEIFRDGAMVKSGDLLVKIDPADAQSSLLDAKAALADAEAQKAEAEEAIVGAEQELDAAGKQLELRKQSLERQRQLLEKGYATKVQVETEELSVAALEQSLSSRYQSVVTARKRIERMELSVERAQIASQDAERKLEETSITAPFDGRLDQVNATLGRRVSTSETLAVLIDPTALEASFTLSTEQYSRFLDARGQLIEAPVSVELQLGNKTISVAGHLARAAAVVAAGDAGRQVFASLDVDADTILRPGDFVTVRISEPRLTNIARVPAAAVSEQGELLIVDGENRLRNYQAKILRRMDDVVLLGDVPFGTAYVVERLPHLGPGLKVDPRAVAPDEAPAEAPKTGNKQVSLPAGTTVGGAVDLVDLEPARRAALIAQVNARAIPDDRKTQMLELLNQPQVPRDLVERIENGQGRRG